MGEAGFARGRTPPPLPRGEEAQAKAKGELGEQPEASTESGAARGEEMPPAGAAATAAAGGGGEEAADSLCAGRGGDALRWRLVALAKDGPETELFKVARGTKLGNAASADVGWCVAAA